ncbi:hypothetical protein [Thiomicrospira microaerophila]|uniref:hypothetical protein n=1 Tax=Thiomicrospira microaerophila TaxID=406020 RepID=UPI0005C8A64F|nr:hypothetical protein [Thiomicrospira microaerophila]
MDANTTQVTKPKKWGIWILFASVPTLLCCALPVVLVSLGMGSAVVSLYSDHLPFLQWFGMNEHITFGVTAVILAFAAWLLYRPGRTCPADPALAQACQSANKWNLRFYWGAVAIWCIGAFFAFVLPILQAL